MNIKQIGKDRAFVPFFADCYNLDTKTAWTLWSRLTEKERDGYRVLARKCRPQEKRVTKGEIRKGAKGGK